MNYSDLQNLIDKSDNIVFLGGAGVSTESGIPDFRSVDGLYNQKFDYPPETMLSHDFFVHHKEEFFKFYRDKVLILGAKPNPAHYFLAELERANKLKAVITQNIDGLHQMAGSKNVIELHGSIHRNYCTKCNKFYSAEDLINIEELVPHCDCGGVIKPDVVLYQEALDMNDLKRSVEYISNADILIIGGTSLNVYPAAGLMDYYRGDKLVLINRDKTPRDYLANYIFHDKIGELFGKLKIN